MWTVKQQNEAILVKTTNYTYQYHNVSPGVDFKPIYLHSVCPGLTLTATVGIMRFVSGY